MEVLKMIFSVLFFLKQGLFFNKSVIKKTIFVFLIILTSYRGHSQKVIYSKSVILNIPPKKSAEDSSLHKKNKIEEIKDATIEFVNIADSLSHNKNGVETQVSFTIDTVDENNLRFQVINFYFQPVGEEVAKITDYPSGTYNLESSNLSIYLVNIVKETLRKKILFYAEKSDSLLIKIRGMADAAKLRGIRYKSEFGEKIEQEYYMGNEIKTFSILKNKIVKKNSELAVLRTIGIRKFLENTIEELQNFNVNFEHYVEISEEIGGKYRRVSLSIVLKQKL